MTYERFVLIPSIDTLLYMIVMIFFHFSSRCFELLYTAAWGNLPLVCSDPHMVCSTNTEYEYKVPLAQQKLVGNLGSVVLSLRVDQEVEAGLECGHHDKRPCNYKH